MKIFIGSTYSDLVEYRAAVMRAIDRLRLQGHAVEWLGMEAFSAAAQKPLEECLRYVDQADVYVGFFGVRYGSKIPGSDMSFTEAEFRRVVERGIPLLLFLIDEENANVKPKDFERDLKSLERLTALKKEIGDKWKVDFFKSPEDLAQKFLTAIQPHLVQATTTTPPLRADLAALREQYAAHLVDALDKIDATRIAASLDRTLERIALTDVYVPLKASVAIPERDVYDKVSKVAGRRVAGKGNATQSNDPLIRQAMEQWGAEIKEMLEVYALNDALAKYPGLVILGDPGSGKSTFLKYATIAFARNEQAVRLGVAKPKRMIVAKGKTNKKTLVPEPSIAETRLPIFVTIAAYAERLREDHHQIPLADYFAEYYRDVRGIAGDLAPLFRDALTKGQAIVLLDGLDEVKDIAERARIAKQVENFWNAHRKQGNRLVITSRIIGYEKLGAQELTHLTLHDFDDDAIKQFLDQWCPVIERAAESDATTAARNAERERRELQDAIFRGASGVRELAANPLLLTLLVLIKRKGVRLPEQRVELYEEYIKALVENWALHRNPDRIITHTPKYSEIERVLAALALWMRETNPDAGTVDQPAMETWLTQRYGGATVSPDEARRAAQKFVNDLRHDSGLIVERGHRVYGFIHQTLEEYLAAKGLCYLDDTNLDALLAEMKRHDMFARDVWRETTLLAVGHLAVIQRTPHRAAQLIEKFLREDTLGWSIVRAGEALRDLGRASVPGEIWNATLDALKTTMQGLSVPIKIRAAAGENLDALGWLPSDLGSFIYVPTGKTMCRAKRVDVKEFYIAKYPVTYSQYEKFIIMGGYTTECYWINQRGVEEQGRERNLGDEAWEWLQQVGGSARRPGYWNDPRFHRAGYPVVGVSWYEANAYCRWFTEQFYNSGFKFSVESNKARNPVSKVADSRWSVRLPTEAEWVHSAGGDADARYCWDEVDGNRGTSWKTENQEFVLERLNAKENELNSTTPVAMYKDGGHTSETGGTIFDLGGNVWEWTNTIDKPGSMGLAVLRGGAYYMRAELIRASARYGDYRSSVDDAFGFRLIIAM